VPIVLEDCKILRFGVLLGVFVMYEWSCLGDESNAEEIGNSSIVSVSIDIRLSSNARFSLKVGGPRGNFGM
jgi:hypothetical protein